MSTSSGFTLIELMVTIALAAILMALAAPSFSATIASNRLSAQTSDLITSLNAARSESIRRGRRVTVCKSVDGSSCATEGDWSTGWIAFEDKDSDAVVDEKETVLLVHQTGENLTMVKGTTNVSSYVSFTPDGRAKLINGSTQSGTLRVCSKSSALGDTRRARNVTVNPVGRIESSVISSTVTCPAAT